MTTLADIKAEPLAIWDTRTEMRPSLWHLHYLEACKWAQVHIEDAASTYRAEFYLVDAPFAVLYRYICDDHGHVLALDATGEPVLAEPVVQMLDELPPAHLLGR